MFKYKKNKGSSFVEVIFIVAIMILVGLAIWMFQKNVFYMYSIMQSGLGAEKDARKLVKDFSAEARTASMSSDGSYPIALANSTGFTFFADIDGDSVKEKVRYFLDNKTIKKGVIEPSGNPLTYPSGSESINIIAQNIDNGTIPVFEYFDKNYDGTGSALTTPVDVSKIRLVKITVIIDKSSVRSPAPMRITTQVSLRNLKDNL